MASEEPDLIAEAKGRKERGWRFYVASFCIVLALVFVLQNTDSTNINFLFAEGSMPLFFALLIALVLGMLIGWLTPRVRRSEKRE
ncbi:MAG TPA: LapA family protein [Solirubrobacterales bacterium]|nr:LapA family protein [Solirubrobacterales bacterium]